MPEPLSIGILYPTTWYGDPTGFDAAIKRLRGLDPTIEVRVVEYQEPPEQRHRRQIGAADDALDETPPVSDEVADVYPKIMHEGNMDAGAWSCGMVAGLIHDIPTVQELIDRIMVEADDLIKRGLASL